MASHDDTVDWQPPPEGPPPLEVGSRIDGFVVDRIIGMGAFGVVAEATDVVTQRKVAIKALKRAARGAETMDRVICEARRAAALEHDNIVRIYHVVIHEGGTAYIVMQFVDGPNLAELISSEAPLSYPAAAKITVDVARALMHAHQHGFIHLDIKPSNILINKDGRALVADFGIAVHHDERWDSAIGGTPCYMAPEQVQGANAQLDGRADLWALGVVLYEMVTARRPFTGGSGTCDYAKLIREICSGAPKPASQWNPKIPRPIDEICLRCLAKEPQGRFRSAAELIEAVEAADAQIQKSNDRLGPASRFWLADERYEDDASLSKRELITRGCLVVAAILVGMLLLVFGIVAPRRFSKWVR